MRTILGLDFEFTARRAALRARPHWDEGWEKYLKAGNFLCVWWNGSEEFYERPFLALNFMRLRAVKKRWESCARDVEILVISGAETFSRAKNSTRNLA
jgi:hypothetical protein